MTLNSILPLISLSLLFQLIMKFCTKFKDQVLIAGTWLHVISYWRIKKFCFLFESFSLMSFQGCFHSRECVSSGYCPFFAWRQPRNFTFDGFSAVTRSTFEWCQEKKRSTHTRKARVRLVNLSGIDRTGFSSRVSSDRISALPLTRRLFLLLSLPFRSSHNNVIWCVCLLSIMIRSSSWSKSSRATDRRRTSFVLEGKLFSSYPVTHAYFPPSSDQMSDRLLLVFLFSSSFSCSSYSQPEEKENHLLHHPTITTTTSPHFPMSVFSWLMNLVLFCV